MNIKFIETSSMTSLKVFDLPGVEAIMSHILSYVPLKDRLKLEIVSSKFKKFLHHSIKCTKYFDFKKIIPNEWKSDVEKCRKIHTQILNKNLTGVIKLRNLGIGTKNSKHEDFDYSDLFPFPTVNLKDLSFCQNLPLKFTQILPLLSSLKELQFCGLEFATSNFNNSLLELHNLEFLTIHTCNFIGKSHLFIPTNVRYLHILGNFEAFDEINEEPFSNRLGFSPITGVSGKSMKIEQLVIDGAFQLCNNQGFIAMLEDMKELRKLFLSGAVSDILSCEISAETFKFTPKLEELHLLQFDQFKFTTDSLIQACPNLKKLSVSENMSDSYDQILNLANYSPNLTELYVDLGNEAEEIDPQPANVSLQKLAQNAPNLQKLSLRNLCKDVTQTFSLAELAILLPKLEYLDISYSQIEDSDVQAFLQVLADVRPQQPLILCTYRVNCEKHDLNWQRWNKYDTKNIPGLIWEKNNWKQGIILECVFNQLKHWNESDYDINVQPWFKGQYRMHMQYEYEYQQESSESDDDVTDDTFDII